MYLLKHVATDRYVTPPGSRHSYTSDLREAVVFATREAAEAGRCPGSEVIVSVASQLQPVRT